MSAFGYLPNRSTKCGINLAYLFFVACFFLNSVTASGQDGSTSISGYLSPLNEQQKDLGRINDALKGGIQQIERACKPFIDENSLERAELKPPTYLQINQARTTIENNSNAVRLGFENTQNVAKSKEAEICNSTRGKQPTDQCLSLKFTREKLSALEAYFVETTKTNIQIIDHFVLVGKLEALKCVRPDFTSNIIQSYLQRVDETDISGLKFYQSKLDQLKTEIQDYD